MAYVDPANDGTPAVGKIVNPQWGDDMQQDVEREHAIESAFTVSDPLFGARGDGVTDDTAAFLAAANAAAAAAPAAAANPAVILTPGKTYKLTSGVVFPAGTNFYAPGAPGSAVMYFPTDTGQSGRGLVGTVLNGATSVPLTLVTETFPAGGGTVAVNAGGAGSFTYTGVTGSGRSITLTGCAGVTAAMSGAVAVIGYAMCVACDSSQNITTVLDGGILLRGPSVGSFGTWGTSTPPNSLDGIYLMSNQRINIPVTGFRHATAFSGDHERWGKGFRQHANYSAICCASPRQGEGDQLIEAGAMLDGCYWASIYVTAGNRITNMQTGKIHLGFEPWAVWKEALPGNSDDLPYVLLYGDFNMWSVESCGLGVIGTPDGKSSVTGAEFRALAITWSSFSVPSGQSPVAAYACQIANVTWSDDLAAWVWGSTPVSPYFNGSANGVAGFGFNNVINAVNAATAPLWSTGPGGGQASGIQFNIGVSRGAVIPVIGAVNINDLIGMRNNSSGEQFQRAAQSYAGFAATAGTSGASVPVFTASTSATANVATLSTPPTSPSATTSATAGTLSAGTYYYKVAAILSGGGVTGASTEVNVTLSGSNSAQVSWIAPASPPHAQTVTGYRLYRGTSTGNETGYILPGNVTSFTDSGSSLTAGAPTTNNTGCEVYGINYLRAYGASQPGKICVWQSGDALPILGATFTQADNGSTVSGITIAGPLALG